MTISSEIELEPLGQPAGDAKPLLGAVLPFLGSVKVHVAVRAGTAELSVAELTELKQGGILKLDRLTQEPFDILVDGNVIARGTLVAVGDHFGVRITETVV